MARILVVDDERATNVLSSDYLRLAGFEVHSCFDGESALEILSADPEFDLVVMDKRMPGMGGVEAAKAIRGGERTAKILIILLSASLQPSQIKEVDGEVRADAYIPKPFSPKELVATVKRLLEAAS
jgi:two-component system phosphate regulon response regulator PhoB